MVNAYIDAVRSLANNQVTGGFKTSFEAALARSFYVTPPDSGDATSRIEAAKTAAVNAGGGVVYVQGGSCEISDVITFPEQVALIGQGMGVTTFSCQHADAQILFDGTGDTGLPCGGFTVAGESTANNPLKFGSVSSRLFYGIRVNNSLQQAVVFEDSDNATFINFRLGPNAGDGLVFQNNARNLEIIHSAINNVNGASVKLTNSSGLVPQYIRFRGGIWETSNGATGWNRVLIDAGLDILFDGVRMHSSGETSNSSLIKFERNGAFDARRIEFQSCFVSAQSGDVIFDVDVDETGTTVPITVISGRYAGSGSTFFRTDNRGRMRLFMPEITASTFFTATGAASEAVAIQNSFFEFGTELDVRMTDLPTMDPGVSGKLWANSNVVTRSA